MPDAENSHSVNRAPAPTDEAAQREQDRGDDHMTRNDPRPDSYEKGNAQ